MSVIVRFRSIDRLIVPSPLDICAVRRGEAYHTVLVDKAPDKVLVDLDNRVYAIG